MSRYNKYAKELDTLARNNFQQYQKAAEEFEKAEKYYKENKRPDSGWWNATSEMIAKASDAESKYHYAKDGSSRCVGATNTSVLLDLFAEQMDSRFPALECRNSGYSLFKLQARAFSPPVPTYIQATTILITHF